MIELLVVISIIGLLSTVGLVALGSARAKARDVKRVADLKQVQKALEMYNNDPSTVGYPQDDFVLGQGSGVTGDGSCGDQECTKISISGITNQSDRGSPVFMTLIPPDPSSPTKVYCSTTTASPCYPFYRSTDPESFQIQFYLEKGIESLVQGYQCLTDKGFLNRPCEFQ